MTKVFVIAQGGGPTAVINQTLIGAAVEARRQGARVLGARYGVRGVAAGDFVDLSEIGNDDLGNIAITPGSALGSTRDKPDAAYCERILAGLKGASADAFIYIGGNDTAATLQVLEREAGGDIAFIHAPKTIDNDLVQNDHTPGFISAGLFVVAAFVSIDLDFRALPGIYVGIVMGRHAGFLTASAATWRRDESDGPHLVYVPEVPFSVDKLIDDIRTTHARYGRCVVAMSEGVATEGGGPLAESLIPASRLERDAHGNVQISGGDLGLALQERIKQEFPGVRARVDTFGYLPRGYIATVSPVDSREAFDVGVRAVAACDKMSGSVTIQHVSGATGMGLVDLAAVAGKTRLVPAEYLDPAAAQVSPDGIAYFSRLLPAPPPISTSLL